MSELTFEELKIRFCQNEPGRIQFEWIVAASHARRVALVEDAVRWISQEHTKTKHVRKDRTEDGLTIDIITDLKAMQIPASHDTQFGGHCDIAVEGPRNFLWIAEAKKHDSYDWLLQGFNQLDTRYSTGLENQNTGAMIIYSYNARVDQMMENWQNHLLKRLPTVTVMPRDEHGLEFRTKHTHEATGADFFVWHFPISLYFKPMDKALK